MEAKQPQAARYRVRLRDEMPGIYTPDELGRMPGITPTTLVCPADHGSPARSWRLAVEFPDIAVVLHPVQACQGPAESPAPPARREGARVMQALRQRVVQLEQSAARVPDLEAAVKNLEARLERLEQACQTWQARESPAEQGAPALEANDAPEASPGVPTRDQVPEPPPDPRVQAALSQLFKRRFA